MNSISLQSVVPFCSNLDRRSFFGTVFHRKSRNLEHLESIFHKSRTTQVHKSFEHCRTHRHCKHTNIPRPGAGILPHGNWDHVFTADVSQKLENRRFRNFMHFSSILDPILASFFEHFGINFRYFFGIDFEIPFGMPFFDFSRKCSPKGLQNGVVFRCVLWPFSFQNASATQPRFFIGFEAIWGPIFFEFWCFWASFWVAFLLVRRFRRFQNT